MRRSLIKSLHENSPITRKAHEIYLLFENVAMIVSSMTW